MSPLRKIFLTTKNTKLTQRTQRKESVLQHIVHFVKSLCVLCGITFCFTRVDSLYRLSEKDEKFTELIDLNVYISKKNIG